MGFIIEGFLGIALIVAAVWLAMFWRARREAQAQRAREHADAERERLLQAPGERLVCVGCGHEFDGPLDEMGCPECSCAAFVVPARHRAQIAADAREPVRLKGGRG